MGGGNKSERRGYEGNNAFAKAWVKQHIAK